MARRVILSLLVLLVLVPGLWAGTLRGQVRGPQGPLAGARVHPDRLRRVGPEGEVPWVLTDARGRFSLELEEGDGVIAVEKSGYVRDLVPRAAWADPILLRPAPEWRREKVLVVRLDFPDEPRQRPVESLRRLLFGRAPGEATVANYLYEISKGSLELEEGAILELRDGAHPAPRGPRQGELLPWVLRQVRGLDLGDLDTVDNRTGALRPDGKPDHLWVLTPGPPRSVTTDARHVEPACYLQPLPWRPRVCWPMLLATEQTPLGLLVHETLHAMGENRVDDLYLDCDHPDTAGIWDLMDGGQYRGWDRLPGPQGPWEAFLGYSPSQPGPWVRADLWYRGRFQATVPTLELRDLARKGEWTGWIETLARAPGELPQRVKVPDPRRRGHFWELSVRRPWGFDRGRIGGRWGAGNEGLLVDHVSPERLSDHGASRGPLRVVNAHPDLPEPPPPRLPCGRWKLDGAAFNLGPGEVAEGSEGPLAWEVLEAEAGGGLKVRLRWRGARARKGPGRPGPGQ